MGIEGKEDISINDVAKSIVNILFKIDGYKDTIKTLGSDYLGQFDDLELKTEKKKLASVVRNLYNKEKDSDKYEFEKNITLEVFDIIDSF